MFDTHTQPQNYLLATVSSDVRDRLLPHLERVPLRLGDVLHESGDSLCHVYFPIDAVVSMLCVMQDGAAVEISVVGNEGFIGTVAFTGDQSTRNRAMVHRGGYAYRILGSRLKDEFSRHGELLLLMLRYTETLIAQTAQNAVCNRRHSIDQHLCRWLLGALDRSRSNRISVTHEKVANMLGVRREGVTDAAGKLQKLGIIKYQRGLITVLDRAKLEQRSCECYAIVRKETHPLPLPAPQPIRCDVRFVGSRKAATMKDGVGHPLLNPVCADYHPAGEPVAMAA